MAMLERDPPGKPCGDLATLLEQRSGDGEVGLNSALRDLGEGGEGGGGFRAGAFFHPVHFFVEKHLTLRKTH